MRVSVRFASILGVSVFALLWASFAIGEPAWDKEKETSDGVIVYSRVVPGTTVRELKATLAIEAPPVIVLDAACDPTTFRGTIKQYVEENAYYRNHEPNAWYNYQLINFPVVARRDYTLRYERAVDEAKQVYRLTWSTSTLFGPRPRDGIVRVTLADGRIDVTPVEGGKRSRVQYTLLADPGGNIPAWVINLANRHSLPAILREIRDEAVRRASR